MHCARRTIAQFAIKYCNPGHFLRVLHTEAADRNSYREAEINNIHRFQFSLVYREVESHCLSIFRNISLNIFVETTLVLRCHTCNCGNVFVEGLINTRAVRNISIIVQLENTRLDVLTIVLQCCQERRHRATSHILHRNVVIGNDLTIGIIIIDDLKVGFLFNRFQINQDKLSSVFRTPSDVAVLTVDHGRRACVCDFVPHGRLIVPLRPSIGRNLFPCDGVRSIPHICSGVALAVTIRYRDLGDRVVRVISRRDDANVAVSPVVEDRCGFEIHVFLGWGNRAVRIDNRNRQRDLAHSAGSIRRSASCTIAPVLDIGVNFRGNFRLLQVIGNRLIRVEEIMPSAVQCLILPRASVIAHMGKRCAVSGLIIARSIRLFVVFIQTHGLPIVHFGFEIVKGRITSWQSDLLNFDTLVSACICALELIRTRSRVSLSLIYTLICDPVLQRQRSICHRTSRSLVLDNDRIQHIADYNLRRADLLAGEGDGGLINRRWCRFQRVGITLGATTAARHCPVSPGESNIIVGITTIPARDFKIEFACL